MTLRPLALNICRYFGTITTRGTHMFVSCIGLASHVFVSITEDEVLLGIFIFGGQHIRCRVTVVRACLRTNDYLVLYTCLDI